MSAILEYISMHATELLSTWLTMQLQTGLFILIIFAIDVSLRNASPRFRYLLWSTALLKAVLPPVVSLPSAAEGVFATVTLPVIDVQGLATGGGGDALPIESLVVIAVVVMAFVLAALVAYRSLSLHRSLGSAEPLSHNAWSDGPPVFVSTAIPSPVAVGVLRPRIYVTHDVADGPTEILEAVLHHEHAHIRRRDGLVVILQSLIQIFYVVNPLVWLLNLRLFRYREQICDQEALLRTGTRPQDYGRLLLRYAEAQPSRIVQTGTCFFETRRGFVQRVSQLFHAQEGKNINRIHRFAIVALLIVIVPLSWRCSEEEETPLHSYKQSDFTSVERWIGDSTEEGSASLELGDPVFSTVHYRKEGKLKTGHAPRIVGGLQALSKHVEYPEEALKKGTEGTIIVQARIMRDGLPESVECLYPGDLALERAAMAAVRKTEFIAARRNGIVQEAEISIPVRFKLK
ncbi:MAG: hypothetical protein C0600_14825 [Ignavibacteria bacterium]|nr:MAG: hypothetical protein C0600_14825 [Ignavibacteria bacterium]